MIRADSAPHLPRIGASDALSSASPELDNNRPQAFGDFSGFQGADQVGLGRATASADPGHAARAVAGFVLEP